MDRRFLAILGGIVVIFIALFAINSHSNNTSGGSTGNAEPTNHLLGNGSAGVTLVEYGDYECPVCDEYYQPLKQVSDQFANKIYFQFRNLPLSQIHLNAFAGARAAEAADLQGKFWGMHDLLYENQDPSGASGWVASKDPLNDYFVSYAKNLGLNVTKFKQDFASDQVNNKISADLAEFDKTGQQKATPAFFLDGKFIDNSQLIDSKGVSATKFANLINAEIVKKQSSAKN